MARTPSSLVDKSLSPGRDPGMARSAGWGQRRTLGGNAFGV